MLGEEAHSAAHFLTDKDSQRLATEVGLALGDLAGEEGFGMDQQPGQEVGFELAQAHWLVEHLGADCRDSAQLLQDSTGSRGGICGE